MFMVLVLDAKTFYIAFHFEASFECTWAHAKGNDSFQIVFLNCQKQVKKKSILLIQKHFKPDFKITLNRFDSLGK